MDQLDAVSRLYLWIDFETTGLDIPDDCVLEAGWVISSSRFPYRMISNPRSALVIPRHTRMVERVRQMHLESGLWDDIFDPDTTSYELHQAERLICDDVDKAVSSWKNVHQLDDVEVVVAGSGVAFDRDVIKAFFPNLDARLHYSLRSVSDIVRSLREAFPSSFTREAFPSISGKNPLQAFLTEHRALDDALLARERMYAVMDEIKTLVEGAKEVVEVG